jgi:hypothetical protein
MTLAKAIAYKQRAHRGGISAAAKALARELDAETLKLLRRPSAFQFGKGK